jgi:hypothetical protein
MAWLPQEILGMLSAPGIRAQLMVAVERLARARCRELEPIPADTLGWAYVICHTWQRRILSALRREIPGWAGFAGFRWLIDYSVPGDALLEVFARENIAPDGEFNPHKERVLTNEGQCRSIYEHYCVQRKDVADSKTDLTAGAESFFLRVLGQGAKSNPAPSTAAPPYLDRFLPLLGGQAGNVLWMWACLGAQLYGFVPYFTERFLEVAAKFPEFDALRVITWSQGGFTEEPMRERKPGVTTGAQVVDAPWGASVVAIKADRRLIYQFGGVRVFNGIDRPWDRIHFKMGGSPLGGPVAWPGSTWPTLPFFCSCSVDLTARELVIELPTSEQLANALQNRFQVAIIGGLNDLMRGDWLNIAEPELRKLLIGIMETQLRVLAKLGVRIGIELSGAPNAEYAHLLRRLCRDEIIVAVGINGVEELPQIVSDDTLGSKAVSFLVESRIQEALKTARPDFRVYARAQALAELLGVRTLFVHTTTFDLILRKDADPGALFHAQVADIIGKGAVIAGLLKRTFRDQWLEHLARRMPPAPNPEAMAALAEFAQDFDHFVAPGSFQQITEQGFWLAPSPSEYSLAAVPVIWPPVSEQGSGPDLPEGLNTTGAGDMTFAAFFFLSGV